MCNITLDELKQYRAVRDNVSAIDEQISHIRAEAERVTTDLQRIGGRNGIQQDRIALFVSQLEALAYRRTEAYITAVELLDRIDNAIMLLPDPQAKVIRGRYIDGVRFNGWEVLARKLNYSRSGVLALHRAALKNMGIY